MGPIILLPVLNVFFVIVRGHNYNRINQVGSPDEDCDLRSKVTTIKETLAEAVLEKCLMKPNDECVPVAIFTLQPCLKDLDKIDPQCFSDALTKAQGAGYEVCFCGGVTSLVTSLVTVAPLVCSSDPAPGSRLGRMVAVDAEAVPTFASLMGSEAKPMIIDTDMAIDVNDPLALCAAHGIETEGYADIKAVVSNVGYPSIIGAVSVINHYFGRDNITLGAYKGTFGNDFDGGMNGKYVDDLVNNFESPVKNYNSVDDAVEVIRKTLTEAEDNSIVYVAIGFMINLRDFLAAEGNRELFAKKVNVVFIRGGRYVPESKTPEFFFGCGVVSGKDTYSNTDECKGSAKAAIENIPDSVPVRFLGYEASDNVQTGGAFWSWCPASVDHNPCFRVLSNYHLSTGNKQTLSWDPMTVTAAAGTEMTVGSTLQGQNGKIKVEEDGTSIWENGFPNSKQLYLSLQNIYLPIVQIDLLYCFSNLYTLG